MITHDLLSHNSLSSLTIISRMLIDLQEDLIKKVSDLWPTLSLTCYRSNGIFSVPIFLSLDLAPFKSSFWGKSRAEYRPATVLQASLLCNCYF